MRARPGRTTRVSSPLDLLRGNWPAMLLLAAFGIVVILFFIFGIKFIASAIKPNTTPAAQGATSAFTPTPSQAVQSKAALETPAPQSTQTGMKMACMYAVEQGDWLGTIMQKFNIYYLPNQEYYYRECHKDGSVMKCNARQPIEDNNYIYEGLWVEIPETGQVDCLRYGGTVGIVGETP